MDPPPNNNNNNPAFNPSTRTSSKNKRRRLRISSDESTTSTVLAVAISNSQERQQPLGVAAEAAANEEPAVSRVPITFRPGFPKLLFGDLQSLDGDMVRQAAQEMAIKIKACALQEFKEFCALGGQAIICVAMRRWAGHSGIQSQGCRCIATMLFVCPDSLFPGVEASLHLMGYMELAVDSMRRFPADQELQCCGLGSLGNLYSKPFRSPTDPKMQSLVRFIMELDGVLLISNAMTTFHDGEGVQEEGCWLLSRLCFLGHEGHPAMREVGLVVVAAALENFPQNPGLAASATSFLEIVS